MVVTRKMMVIGLSGERNWKTMTRSTFAISVLLYTNVLQALTTSLVPNVVVTVVLIVAIGFVFLASYCLCLYRVQSIESSTFHQYPAMGVTFSVTVVVVRVLGWRERWT